ncbi:MAG: hypothetical protein V4681_01590 [Patescibacteria group bacterium]
MKIEWNTVNWYSQAVAIVLFVLVFALGFWLGTQYQMRAFENAIKAELEEMMTQPAPSSGEEAAS